MCENNMVLFQCQASNNKHEIYACTFRNKGTNAPQLGSVKHPDFTLNNRFLKTVSISGFLYYVHPLS